MIAIVMLLPSGSMKRSLFLVLLSFLGMHTPLIDILISQWSVHCVLSQGIPALCSIHDAWWAGHLKIRHCLTACAARYIHCKPLTAMELWLKAFTHTGSTGLSLALSRPLSFARALSLTHSFLFSILLLCLWETLWETQCEAMWLSGSSCLWSMLWGPY